MRTGLLIDTQLDVVVETWPMATPVVIHGHIMREAEVLLVTLRHKGVMGRGEASGVFYLGDAPTEMARQVEAMRPAIERGLTRDALQQVLPPGGARNALDCALWDLESRLLSQPIWRMADLAAPRAVRTTYTLGADDPDALVRRATTAYRDACAIKMKLLGDGKDAARVAAVRSARPDVWLGVDGNQGFTARALYDLLPHLVAAGVQLIEQPCRMGDEAALESLASPIPFAADESVQGLSDLERLVGRFQVANIKLDKCGGLTEALKMVTEAQRLGLQVMVGNMGGTSLAMAPALLVGQSCDIVDLDGPLFLRQDREPSVIYERGYVSSPSGLFGASEAA